MAYSPLVLSEARGLGRALQGVRVGWCVFFFVYSDHVLRGIGTIQRIKQWNQWRMSTLDARNQLSSTSIGIYKTEGQTTWLERTFQRRECVRFIPSTKDNTRCGCGRLYNTHNYLKDAATTIRSPSATPSTTNSSVWDVDKHTQLLNTDAFGTIEFQGGPHPIKAQYVRLSHDTPADRVLTLLQKQWSLCLPKLLISVHGGIANFELQPKLKRVFHKGLFKAAKTTGAWIVTGGTNTGVMYHVGEALGDTLTQARNNIVSVGIAPWGVVHKRLDLIGRDIVTPYHAISSPKSSNVVLNSNHSHFLLADNGTVGKYGCEISFRRKLEKCVAQQKIMTGSGFKNYRTPMVCLVLEGGTNIIRTVFECVTDKPPVPVVVCDGSGRAADILAFTHKYAQDDGTMPDGLKAQLIQAIEKTFQYTTSQAESLFVELMLCVIKKELITVFRMTEDTQDIDLAILTALLKGQTISASDQLSLTLAWDRVDIAKSHIFVHGQEWPEKALEQVMTDALANDRVDFIQLLLENGISMQKWLTIARLEELYNIGLKSVPPKSSSVGSSTQNQDPSSTLRFLIRENKKHIPAGYRYTLFDIGQVMEKLMGGAYRAAYCRKKFRVKYNAVMRKGTNLSNILCEIPLVNLQPEAFALNELFNYPFHHLMIWAVLLRKQKMAMFMWQHGEEALAKALVACKLYKSMAHEAAQDDLEIDISEELQGFAREFSQLAFELLEYCYQTDDDLTQHLLTYELQSWSEQTCLSLAVCASHRDFLAHTSCQILLTDMWMGGLRMRKYTSLKVILGIIFFPSVAWLEFKSKEELQLMPQTVAEHIQELESDSDTSSDGSQQSLPSHIPLAMNERDVANDMYVSYTKKNSRLRWGKRVYEFYTAPVTKFWLHAMTYFLFVLIHTYVVLIRMLAQPSWQEYFVISYIFATAIEKGREIAVSEPKKLSQKLTVYFSDVWNICDTIAIVLFAVGLSMRVVAATRGEGRVLYCVNIIFWYTRMLELFSVNKYLGPYVMMIGKMMKDMLQFIVILLVVLMAFGVVRQSISYPDEEPKWRLARDIFLKPYFMIYGEVYASEIDPDCSDNPDDNLERCVPGRWIIPAVMAVYLIVANILLINLLIAVFNNTFQKVNSISTHVWKFQRYSLVLEYESKPILPPPLILMSHAYLLAKYAWRRCRGSSEYFDNGLKLFLDSEEVERLHDFEEECMDGYFHEKQQRLETSSNERIRSTAQIVENMTLRMDDLSVKENSIKLSLQALDQRMSKLEDLTLQNAHCMQTLLRHVAPIAGEGPRGVVRFHDGVVKPPTTTQPVLDSALYRRRRASSHRGESTSSSRGGVAPSSMAASVPITPIITPLRSEYTSITDGIDTSCMNLTSPCGSPCTPRRVSLAPVGGGVGSGEDDEGGRGRMLKDAEESERAQMEGVVRSRMRQISMTETESVIDIVLHVMRHTGAGGTLGRRHSGSPSSSDNGDVIGRQRSKRSHRGRRTVKRVRSDPTVRDCCTDTADWSRSFSTHSLQANHGRCDNWSMTKNQTYPPATLVNKKHRYVDDNDDDDRTSFASLLQ